jgi:hypothetical protein
MEALVEIVNKAIADYGFRQVVLWSPEDVIVRWSLASREGQVLQGPVRDALEALPIPVEPRDIPAEQDRLARLINDALSGP